MHLARSQSFSLDPEPPRPDGKAVGQDLLHDSEGFTITIGPISRAVRRLCAVIYVTISLTPRESLVKRILLVSPHYG